MNFLKRHLTLIIPLLALLFSLQSYLLIERAIFVKEDKLLQSYSILIASNKEIVLDQIQEINPAIKSIESIDTKSLLKRLQDFNDEQNLTLIQKELPYFYSIKLESFPNQKQLEALENDIKKLPYIIKIETFAKTHNQVYNLLYFIKKIIIVFAALLAIFSLLLMMRQVQIWRFEHQKRMQIMDLLGAKAWMKHKILFKLAFYDSFIASCVITLGSFYSSTHPSTQKFFELLGIQNNIFHIKDDFILLTSFAISISLLSVLFVVFSQKRV
ncbi:cell division protein FtsX [Helicobacter anatolicus]|uniref:cell division protein FtsX n=1 Tax=Helicobacter anatolicus TaxID=2905874 RepID=UPI001E5B5258|nr:cell division protein FtsX [Helicobacter anatolicus]MCE3037800.1 cell division protein FtsX [Helicobacter anatolicus]